MYDNAINLAFFLGLTLDGSSVKIPYSNTTHNKAFTWYAINPSSIPQVHQELPLNIAEYGPKTKNSKNIYILPLLLIYMTLYN